MGELLNALRNPDTAFLRYAFAAGLLASVAFGVVGSYVVVRRISYIAGAIAHCVLGGIGAALYVRATFDVTWCHPFYGAVASALLAALAMGLVSLYAPQREDTVIGALWASGMAIGLLFLAKTPGYVDPMSYLFGNILLISAADLKLVVALDIFILAVVAICHQKFLALCFDEEYAALQGVRVKAYYLLLLALTALTVVLLVSVVGIVMVVALLTLPAAVVAPFARRLWQMMVLAVLVCALFTTSGLALSYMADTPSGPTIILVGAGAYLASLGLSRIRRLRA